MNNVILSEQHSQKITITGMHTRTGIVSGIKVGDMIAGFTKVTGLDRFSHLYTYITGKDCGCDARRAYLNDLFG